MSGNMWEWTTETGKPDGGSILRTVRRGGSFAHNGSDNPISYRRGELRTVECSIITGFRVVLYVK